MKLVIAEKPSVAQSLSAVIGATARKDGYLEGNGWRVSWCVGHLAGLADADSYDPKYAMWRYDDLPILPEHWQMVVGKDKKKQFDILKKHVLGTIIWTPTERKPSSLMALPLPLTALPSRTNTAIPRHSELNLIGYYTTSPWSASSLC